MARELGHQEATTALVSDAGCRALAQAERSGEHAAGGGSQESIAS